MTNAERDREIERLRRLEELNSRRLRCLEEHVNIVTDLVRSILRRFCHSPPTAPVLTATFSGDPMQAALIAVIPSTREDGSALAATDIASLTFQKTSLGADGVTAGPEVTLETATAAAGGLTPDQLAFTDTSSLVGDSYTSFVTDTAGNVGALSNAVVATVVVPPALSPPGAPTLSATFSA